MVSEVCYEEDVEDATLHEVDEVGVTKGYHLFTIYLLLTIYYWLLIGS